MKIALVSVLCLAVAVLSVRLVCLRREFKNINRQLSEILKTDTNATITVAENDRTMAKTVTMLNQNLREMRKKELQIQSQNDELRTAITNISHDLRTPLTAICGYLDLLKDEEKSEEVGRCLTIIENRAQALKALTEELFRYSVAACGQEEWQPERLSLNAALEESLAAYYGVLRENGIEPEIEMPEQPVYRVLDRNALARVFANILGNAVKYSPGDLKVTLHENGDITFSNAAPALNETQAGKLFDRFYTVQSADKSTGLGLSIARSLTERMDADICAAYKNGRLEIMLTFPAPHT